jgi:hypothetical protein
MLIARRHGLSTVVVGRSVEAGSSVASASVPSAVAPFPVVLIAVVLIAVGLVAVGLVAAVLIAVGLVGVGPAAPWTGSGAAAGPPLTAGSAYGVCAGPVSTPLSSGAAV